MGFTLIFYECQIIKENILCTVLYIHKSNNTKLSSLILKIINFIRNNLSLFLLSISLEIAFNYLHFIFQHYPGQTLLCFAKFVPLTRQFPHSHSFPVCIIFAKDVGNSISSVRFSRAFLQVRNFYD